MSELYPEEPEIIEKLNKHFRWYNYNDDWTLAKITYVILTELIETKAELDRLSDHVSEIQREVDDIPKV